MRKIDLPIGTVFHPWKIIGEIYYGTTSERIRSGWIVRCVNCDVEKVKRLGDLTRSARGDKGRRAKCQFCHGRAKGEGGLKKLYYVYQRGARLRDLPFSLSFEHFAAMTHSLCHYCGQEPKTWLHLQHDKSGWASYQYNGIDRMDNAVGYLADNCVPCCEICNRAKLDLPYQVFTQYLRKVSIFTSVATVNNI